MVSDSTVHDKKTALAYLHEVLLAADLDGVEQLNVWSDSPSSQFKNRHIAHCILLMNAAYNCTTARDARYNAVFRRTGTYRGTISEYRYTAAPNDRGLSYDSRRRSINTTSTSPTSPTRQQSTSIKQILESHLCLCQACIQMRVTAFKCKCKCAKRFKCKCKCKCTVF